MARLEEGKDFSPNSNFLVAIGEDSVEESLPGNDLLIFLKENNLSSIYNVLINQNVSLDDIKNIPMDDKSNSSDFNDLCLSLGIQIGQKLKFRTAIKNLHNIIKLDEQFKTLQKKYIVDKADERYIRLYNEFRRRRQSIDSEIGHRINHTLDIPGIRGTPRKRTGSYKKSIDELGFDDFKSLSVTKRVLDGEIPVVNAFVIGM